MKFLLARCAKRKCESAFSIIPAPSPLISHSPSVMSSFAPNSMGPNMLLPPKIEEYGLTLQADKERDDNPTYHMSMSVYSNIEILKKLNIDASEDAQIKLAEFNLDLLKQIKNNNIG